MIVSTCIGFFEIKGKDRVQIFQLTLLIVGFLAGMEFEGLFRQSGNQSEIQALKQKIDSGIFSCL